MNKLSTDERARVIACLVEGNSQRATVRITNVARATVATAIGGAQIRGSSVEEWPVEMFDGFHDSLIQWPWEDQWYKPSPHAEACERFADNIKLGHYRKFWCRSCGVTFRALDKRRKDQGWTDSEIRSGYKKDLIPK